MKWISFAVGAMLVFAALLTSSATSAIGTATLVFGFMLMFDAGVFPSGIPFTFGTFETRSDEIEADYLSFRRAKWRYLLAAIVAVSVGLSVRFTSSTPIQIAVLIGGVAAFVVASFAALFRSCKRVTNALR